MKAVLIWVLCSAGRLPAQPVTAVPKAWDTRALSDWATPPATINVRPGHFSAEEYYGAPVDNCRTYPVYLPDREPPGYWETLKRKRPKPLIDTGKIDRAFGWVAAGKRVWEEIDVPFFRLYDAESISMARSPDYIRKNGDRLIALPDGTLAMYRWVVTPLGVGLGITACASCHTRYLEDGTAIAGAGLGRRTTDALLDRLIDRLLRTSYLGDRPQMAAYGQFGVPWIPDDIHQKLIGMSDEEMGRLFDAQIPA